ncbi:hypothetical protein IC582_004152 [Cucumis melo]
MSIKKKGEEFLVAQVHVDDIIFGGQPHSLIVKLVEKMKTKLEMHMVGELFFFLGFQIYQCESGIFLSQENYARNLIKKFDLDKAKTKRTPIVTHIKASKDSSGEKVDERSRPDIAFVIGVCARYQADPRASHINCVKRILKYVLGTIDFRLWYSFDTTYVLVGYCDAD